MFPPSQNRLPSRAPTPSAPIARSASAIPAANTLNTYYPTIAPRQPQLHPKASLPFPLQALPSNVGTPSSTQLHRRLPIVSSQGGSIALAPGQPPRSASTKQGTLGSPHPYARPSGTYTRPTSSTSPPSQLGGPSGLLKVRSSQQRQALGTVTEGRPAQAVDERPDSPEPPPSAQPPKCLLDYDPIEDVRPVSRMSNPSTTFRPPRTSQATNRMSATPLPPSRAASVVPRPLSTAYRPSQEAAGSGGMAAKIMLNEMGEKRWGPRLLEGQLENTDALAGIAVTSNSMSEDVKKIRDQMYALANSVKALPTREDVGEEIASQVTDGISNALLPFAAKIDSILLVLPQSRNEIPPILVAALEQLRDEILEELPPPQAQHASPRAPDQDGRILSLLNSIMSSLEPLKSVNGNIEQLKPLQDALVGMSGLTEAVADVAAFRQAIQDLKCIADSGPARGTSGSVHSPMASPVVPVQRSGLLGPLQIAEVSPAPPATQTQGRFAALLDSDESDDERLDDNPLSPISRRSFDSHVEGPPGFRPGNIVTAVSRRLTDGIRQAKAVAPASRLVEQTHFTSNIDSEQLNRLTRDVTDVQTTLRTLVFKLDNPTAPPKPADSRESEVPPWAKALGEKIDGMMSKLDGPPKPPMVSTGVATSQHGLESIRQPQQLRQIGLPTPVSVARTSVSSIPGQADNGVTPIPHRGQIAGHISEHAGMPTPVSNARIPARSIPTQVAPSTTPPGPSDEPMSPAAGPYGDEYPLDEPAYANDLDGFGSDSTQSMPGRPGPPQPGQLTARPQTDAVADHSSNPTAEKQLPVNTRAPPAPLGPLAPLPRPVQTTAAPRKRFDPFADSLDEQADENSEAQLPVTGTDPSQQTLPSRIPDSQTIGFTSIADRAKFRRPPKRDSEDSADAGEPKKRKSTSVVTTRPSVSSIYSKPRAGPQTRSRSRSQEAGNNGGSESSAPGLTSSSAVAPSGKAASAPRTTSKSKTKGKRPLAGIKENPIVCDSTDSTDSSLASLESMGTLLAQPGTRVAATKGRPRKTTKTMAPASGDGIFGQAEDSLPGAHVGRLIDTDSDDIQSLGLDGGKSKDEVSGLTTSSSSSDDTGVSDFEMTSKQKKAAETRKKGKGKKGPAIGRVGAGVSSTGIRGGTHSVSARTGAAGEGLRALQRDMSASTTSNALGGPSTSTVTPTETGQRLANAISTATISHTPSTVAPMGGAAASSRKGVQAPTPRQASARDVASLLGPTTSTMAASYGDYGAATTLDDFEPNSAEAQPKRFRLPKQSGLSGMQYTQDTQESLFDFGQQGRATQDAAVESMMESAVSPPTPSFKPHNKEQARTTVQESQGGRNINLLAGTGDGPSLMPAQGGYGGAARGLKPPEKTYGKKALFAAGRKMKPRDTDGLDS